MQFILTKIGINTVNKPSKIFALVHLMHLL